IREGLTMITSAVMVLLICVFVFIPLLLGEIARNRSTQRISNFLLQDRKMSIVPLFATVFGTWISVFAFVGGIGYFYNDGPIYLTSIGWDALFAVLFIIVGKRIWYYGKHNNYFTPTDFFDDIYGSKFLNGIVTTITIICTMIYLQVQIVGGLMVMQIATNGVVSIYMGAFIIFTILVIYLWAGGIRAVALTDAFYGILIVVAILASGFFIMKLAGGHEYVFNNLINKNIANVSLGGERTFARTTQWLALFLIVPIGAFMGPQMWLRNYASSKERNFDIMPLLICLSSIICIGTLFAGSGCASLVDHTENAEALLIEIIMHKANPYFYVFVLIGIYAAIFSTANSQVHALSAIYTMDIHKRYINDKIPEQKLLRVAKFAVIAVSAASYLLVILVPQSIMDLAVIALGGTAQLIVPVIGALYWKRSSPIGAIIGLLSGEGIYLLSIYFNSGDASYCAILALGINILCFISGSITDIRRIKVYSKITSYANNYKMRNE
ncbi:MAG: sodium:solute symporter family protein, partial [Eubacterium sp.]|nr:sodium:solute symporter family protein [Candidatus Colimonas fimequi]